MPRHLATQPQLTPAMAPIGALLALILLVSTTVFPIVGHQVPLTLVPVRIAHASGNPPPDQLFLRAQSGGMTLNGAPVSQADLPETLRLALAAQPDGLVFVSVEGAVRYQEALALFTVIQQAGGRAVGLTSSADLAALMPSSATGEGAPAPAPQSPSSSSEVRP